jgi:Asp-tRNA(Asn)/Glu-tRNA(Gln) amidotransferase A subunit family amidase
VSRFGMMVGTFTQDRIGPLCRSVEDCAVVLHTIAQPDGEDFSVSERPFEWDPRRDVKKLRIGWLAEGFDEGDRNEDWKRNDARSLADLRALGLTLAPFKLPDMPLRTMTNTFGVERAAAFDHLVRERRNTELTTGSRGAGSLVSRLVPAVDYLQAMRVRGLLVRQLADATASLDVYVAPYLDLRSIRPGQPLKGAIYDNFNVANLCGYPCIVVPNGFTAKGTPTGITFVGRPYAEAAVLAVAKAYQDATQWHLKHPDL